jgi:FMN phosphatase YigB (HAD superfamily)
MRAQAVCLLDVDDTLINNDSVKSAIDGVLRSQSTQHIGDRFWQLYEEVRADLSAVSIPVTLGRLRLESADPGKIDALAKSIYSMPFSDFVYPGAVGLLRWLRDVAVPVILSDGDPWYQAKKITDAGLGEAVGGNVLIFLHKEQSVGVIRRWYPAERYLAVDDKAHLLGELRKGFENDLTTIWMRKGHYAADAPVDDPPDFSVSSIPELQSTFEGLLKG